MAKANKGEAQTIRAQDVANLNVDPDTGELVPDGELGDDDAGAGAGEIDNDPVASMNRRNRSGKLKSGLKFKKLKSVTVPVVKLMPDRPVYLRFESKLERSKQIVQKKVGDKPMEPATIAHCLNHENDSECILIVGKMLESVLRESYPDDTYVGKSFELVNHGLRGDKRYNSYSVNEVEIED